MKWVMTFAFVLIGSTATYAWIDEKDFNEKFSKLSKMLHAKCNIIVGISDEDIAMMRHGQFDHFKKEAADRVKRYITCLWISSDVMSLNFTLDPEELQTYMPEPLKETGTKMYLDCLREAKSLKPENPQEMTWNMEKCIYRRDPKNFIMY